MEAQIKFSKESLKEAVKNKDIQSIAKSVFKAMAYTQTVAEIVKPIQQEIIDFYKFEIAAKWREPKYRFEGDVLINRPDDMYLADDTDCNIYYEETHKKYLSAGFKLKEKGYCPLLIAEDLERKVKRAFVDSLEEYIGMNADDLICSGLKHYKAYIEINLRMFAPYCK